MFPLDIVTFYGIWITQSHLNNSLDLHNIILSSDSVTMVKTIWRPDISLFTHIKGNKITRPIYSYVGDSYNQFVTMAT